jgi:transcription antitermination factor NusG
VKAFGCGDDVFIEGRGGKIIWDGRPNHQFVEVEWIDDGTRSGVIPVGKVDAEAAVSEAVVFASVADAFHPGDVEDEKSFHESCLELEEGDIVEVIAGGSGWLYGRIMSVGGDGASKPMRTGYFPENRVSWYGRILQNSNLANLQESWLVTTHYDFSESDVDEDVDWRKSCLTIKEGEVVEVIASGGGWLYGRVADSEPERVGYFPENRISWLHKEAQEAPQQAPEAEAEVQGMLARVGSGFSPGIPGDAEEESAESFWENCLALAPGDVVEVVAAAGGWLYGRVVGAPDRAGFFPENRVSWIGQPVAQEGNNHEQVVISECKDTLRVLGAGSDSISEAHAMLPGQLQNENAQLDLPKTDSDSDADWQE